MPSWRWSAEARTLVHAVASRRLPGRVEYRLYRVRVEPGPEGPVLQGELVQVRPTPPVAPGFPPRPLRVPSGPRRAARRRRRPPGARRCRSRSRPSEEVALAILTNSVEDRALLIPAAPLASDTYTFTWSLDRQRYRAAVADDDTRYRASVTTAIPILATGG